MKIPNKRELQQIAFNHSSDIGFQDFMNLHKKCTGKPYSFLVIDATLASDNPLGFRKNLSERIMVIDDKIRDEKLQYNINRESPKLSALSSGRISKYEYLTDEEILPSNQRQITEQAKFTYSPLGKDFEKQTKTIEDQGEKQIEASEVLNQEKYQKLKSIEGLFLKEMRNNKIENEIDEIKNWEDKIK